MGALGDRNIRAALGDDGVLVATIDMPGRSMNVFSASLMDSLEGLLDTVAERGDVQAVVLSSGKPAFLAGADLEMVRMFTERARHDSAAQLHELCGRLGRIFRRLETNGKPFVAALNGLALGGGLELALACHARVAAEGAQLGLPEIKLGLLPGAGGTQRLPRLIGKHAALQIMLGGEPQPASRAKKLGVVDSLVPLDDLIDSARRRAAAKAQTTVRAPWDSPAWAAPQDAYESQVAHDLDSAASAVGISPEDRRHYPAYNAILSCVVGGWSLPMDEACRWEMDQFVQLIREPVAGNMVRTLFLNRQRAAKLLSGTSRSRPAQAAVLGNEAASVRALLRSARVEVLEDNGSDADTLTIATSPTEARPVASSDRTVAWLRGSQGSPTAFGAASGVWVSDTTPHGRAVEICTDAAGQGEGLGLEVARWLRATPLITCGASLCQGLAQVDALSTNLAEDEKLLAVSLAAARVWRDGSAFDTGIADTVTVIAGFHPAYTGGPFSYLRDRGAESVRADASAAHCRHGAIFAVPERLEELVLTLRRENA